MPRHLLDIDDLSRADVDQLFTMADEGPCVASLAGVTCLAAFFQESTRTRLGFMGAAARQGAAVVDAGDGDRLRLEPEDDQQMVLAEIADIAVLRHWDATFARRLASRGRCCVVNAGAGGVSHPTQALIDAYALTRSFAGELTGMRVVFIGSLLRSAISFAQLAPMLGIAVSQLEATADGTDAARSALEDADVIYVQSLSDTRYDGRHLNDGAHGAALPPWTLDAVTRAEGRIMHAMPRGPELPDSLMHSSRSLVPAQVEHGMAVRAAVLRWLRPSA